MFTVGFAVPSAGNTNNWFAFRGLTAWEKAQDPSAGTKIVGTDTRAGGPRRMWSFTHGSVAPNPCSRCSISLVSVVDQPREAASLSSNAQEMEV